MFSYAGSEHAIHSSQCPWNSLCYLGESQPPPSSDAISRTAAQNHTQTQQHHLCTQTHTITQPRRQAGGCPSCFSSTLVPYS